MTENQHTRFNTFGRLVTAHRLVYCTVGGTMLPYTMHHDHIDHIANLPRLRAGVSRICSGRNRIKVGATKNKDKKVSLL